MKSSLEFWRHRTAFKLSEAALLITENYPAYWSDAKLLTEAPDGFKAIYGQMLIDAATVINENVQSQEDPEVYFDEYALMLDKPAMLASLSDEDRLSVTVEKHELLRWLKTKGVAARFFDDEALSAFETNETLIPALSPANSCYPPELDIAIRAWSTASTSTGKGKAKARIRKWLDENYPDKNELSIAARERISVVANWDNRGGPEKTK